MALTVCPPGVPDALAHCSVLAERGGQAPGPAERRHDQTVVGELVHERLVVRQQPAAVSADDDELVELLHQSGVPRRVAGLDRRDGGGEVVLEQAELPDPPAAGEQPRTHALEDLLELEQLDDLPAARPAHEGADARHDLHQSLDLQLLERLPDGGAADAVPLCEREFRQRRPRLELPPDDLVAERVEHADP
jgi:hypothetical protein